jgi:DNA-binding NtrC family response regulator
METQHLKLAERSEPNEAFLIPFNRPGAKTLAVTDFFTVGRDHTCQLVIKDGYVSSRHARFEIREGSIVLRDLRSRNGTFLNGSRVTEAVLNPNDRLQFGESIYVFAESRPDAEPMTSKNHDWSVQLKRLPAFATTDFPVLITGPSGCGKDIVAQALHRNSGRGHGPFISINCSALSENLIESELFGHVRGSFTGAMVDRKGAFESARTGTLFLDEIGDLPLSLQPKLLRALENREIRPLGSDRSIETDVRIIAATHKNLLSAVSAGDFREDLFYRLNVCHLRPPALRERLEDFEEMLYHFARMYRVRFSFSAIVALKHHPWPGNIRELKNTIARASAYYPGKQVLPEDLPTILEPIAMAPAAHFVSEPTSISSILTQSTVLKEIERDMIVRCLSANRGNQRKTAIELGIAKSTLHDRIKSYGIDLEKLIRA